MKKKLSKTLKRQIGHVKKYQKSYIWIMFVIYSLCAGIYPLIAIIIPKYIIDELLKETINFNNIINLSIVMGASLALLGFFRGYLTNKSQSDFLYIRMHELNNCLKKVHKIDYKYLEDPNFDDNFQIYMKTLQSDGNGYQGTFHELFFLGSLLLSLVFYSLIIIMFSPIVFLVTILAIVLSFVSSQLSKKYEYKHKTESSRAYRRMKYFESSTQDFTYGKDVRVFGMKERLLKSYRIEAKSYVDVIRRFSNKEFKYGFIELLGILLQDGFAYYYLINQAVNNVISIGELTMYLSAIIAFSTTLRSIVLSISNIIEWLGYTQDYFDFMDDESKCSATGTLTAVGKNDTLEIEFKNVSFKYPNTEKYVLKDFNLKINKKEKVAIVGINGAGKSTIAKLITGLYYPTSGEIIVNGKNILEYNKEEYYKMFSAVFQDFNIFAFSVKENISMKNANETDDEKVVNVLKSVNLYEKINQFNKTIDTPLLKIIEDDGVELSGGQNQKLAIARALYKDANMLILDEPTASLDALAEAEIYEDFSNLVNDKTAVYISHRLASTKFCDKIVLLGLEGILEYGTHDELISKKGLYYDMFVTQGKYYRNGGTTDEKI